MANDSGAVAIDGITVGLLLISIAVTAFGVRIASKGRPERRRWSHIATLVIVVLFVGLAGWLALTALTFDMGQF